MTPTPASQFAVDELVHQASQTKKIMISACTAMDIEDVLQLDVSRVRKDAFQWELPVDVEKCVPSKWFRQAMTMLQPWNSNSDATTRTKIDIFLLDVTAHANKKSENDSGIGCWGEMSLSACRDGMQLNGRGDYFLGYGRGEGGKSLHTLLIAGEAKARGASMSIWQIIAYCGIIHNIRKTRPESPNSTVYGFITDGAVWEFVRIDNDGKVWTSAPKTNETEVETWLAYLIHCSRRCTPSATPTSSLSVLYHAELDPFEAVVEKFITLPEINGPQDDDNCTDDDDCTDDEEEAVAFRNRFDELMKL